MGPEFYWMGGMWFFPVTVLIVLVIVVLIFVHRGIKSTNFDDLKSMHLKDSESALEILKKRYAKGEISKEEYEQIKKDIL